MTNQVSLYNLVFIISKRITVMLIATSAITAIACEDRPELVKTSYYMSLPEATDTLAVFV